MLMGFFVEVWEGGRRESSEDGGTSGGGEGRGLAAQGGRWISWTCPTCRPGATRSVAFGSVARAKRPVKAIKKLGYVVILVNVIHSLTVWCEECSCHHNGRQLTSFILTSLPFTRSRDFLAVRDVEHDNPPLQRDNERAPPTCQAPDLLPKLQFDDLLSYRLIPEDDLIWWIPRVPAPSYEEDDVGIVQRQNLRDSPCQV